MAEEASFLDRVIANYTANVNDAEPYSDSSWATAVRVADAAVSLLEASPPGRILDLACGKGASTAALAMKGFDVTGIDCTPASVEIARRESVRKGASLEWLCEDMRELSYKGQFDYVCLRDVIFGVFEDSGEDVDLIRRIARALKPAGRCLLEVYNREFALAHGAERVLFHDEAVDRFVRPGAEPGALSMRLYSHDQWRQMLAAHGLRIVATDGWSWPNDPPPPPWRADLIVAEKE